MAGKKQKRPYLTLDQIEAALIKNKGIMTAAGESLGVSRSTVSERVRRSERLQKVIDDQRKVVGDFAESKLYTHIKDGNLTAIIFYLKTLGRDRGYIERHENELSTDPARPVKFTIEFVEPTKKNAPKISRKTKKSDSKAKKI